MIELQLVPFLVGVGSLLFLLILGIPISFCLLAAGLIGSFILVGPTAISLAATTMSSGVGKFALCALPLFILMGEIVKEGRTGEDAFKVARLWLGKVPGSLAIAANMAGAVFGAACGSTVASTAMFGTLAIPDMLKQGYNKKLSTGSIAGAGCLASLIPPSTGMILYGIITDTSIGRLFIGGVVPGLILTAFNIIIILIWAQVDKKAAPVFNESISWKVKFLGLKGILPMAILIVMVLGSIYGGVCTPSEAAGIGSFVAVCIGFVQRRMNFKGLFRALQNSIPSVGMILLITVCAMMFGRFIVQTGSTQALVRTVGSLSVPPWVIIVMINLLLFVLGCFLDPGSICLIVIPILFPVVVSIGYDSVWFGVVFIINMEVAMATPPVGMNLFVLKGVSPELPMKDIISGALIFAVADCVLLAAVTIWPEIILWLPTKMIG